MEKEHRVSFPKRAGLMILPWVTLFPGGLLPLRIFEERYRNMLKDALVKHRMFAIAHVDEILAEKLGVDWNRYGTLGVLRACVTNEDGTSNLILQGVARVEFAKHSQVPYPQADIKILHDSSDTSETIDRLRATLLNLIQNPADIETVLPQGFADHLATIESPGSFADIVASTLITNPLERRYLLEEFDVTTRLQLLVNFLQKDDPDSDIDPTPAKKNQAADAGDE